jgi:hypothetical protein
LADGMPWDAPISTDVGRPSCLWTNALTSGACPGTAPLPCCSPTFSIRVCCSDESACAAARDGGACP